MRFCQEPSQYITQERGKPRMKVGARSGAVGQSNHHRRGTFLMTHQRSRLRAGFLSRNPLLPRSAPFARSNYVTYVAGNRLAVRRSSATAGMSPLNHRCNPPRCPTSVHKKAWRHGHLLLRTVAADGKQRHRDRYKQERATGRPRGRSRIAFSVSSV
jgi:hypothetical protein